MSHHTNVVAIQVDCTVEKEKKKKKKTRCESCANTRRVSLCSLFADGLEDVFHILLEDDFAGRLLDLEYTSDASSDVSI